MYFAHRLLRKPWLFEIVSLYGTDQPKDSQIAQILEVSKD